MDSVKDLVKHLEKCENGSSMKELVNKFRDKSVIKTFLNIALDDGKIRMDGKRYYAKEKVSIAKKDINAYIEICETLEDCLSSTTPVIGEKIFCKNFISNKGDRFLLQGITTEEYIVAYSKSLNKNVVLEKKSKFNSNAISVRRDGSLYVMMIINNCDPAKSTTESYKSYEDFRSSLLAILGV
jgi:hypothetical protein